MQLPFTASVDMLEFFFFFILRRMGKNKALALEELFTMGGIRPLWLGTIWVMPDQAREVSIRQMLLCRCGQGSSSAELMTRRHRKGGGVFIIIAVSNKRRRWKSGAVECAWRMLNRSHLKTL